MIYIGELGPQKALHATVGDLDFPLGHWWTRASSRSPHQVSILSRSLQQRVDVDQKGSSQSLGSGKWGGGGGDIGRREVDLKERGVSEAESRRQVWEASHRSRPVPVTAWKREGRLLGSLGFLMSREIEGALFSRSWSSPQYPSWRSPCMCPKERAQGISPQYSL